MKTLRIGLSFCLLLAAALGFSLVSTLNELEQQTEYANRYQQQLLTQTEEVKKRQVIVFTHDVYFLYILQQEA